MLEEQFQWKQWLDAPYLLTFPSLTFLFHILGIGGKYGIYFLKTHN